MVQVKEKSGGVLHAMRLSFRKVGALQYISHLDLQRTFTRAIVRAQIPIWYTEGFNPKPRISFSTPLSVGCESIYELMDFRIVRDMDKADIMAALNRNLPPELSVSEVYMQERKFTDIAYASYVIRIEREGDETTAARVASLLSEKPIVVCKRTKSGDKDTDIAPTIKSAAVFCQGDDLVIETTLSAGAAEYLNPEYIVDYLSKSGAVLTGEMATRLYSICRTDLLDKELKHFR